MMREKTPRENMSVIYRTKWGVTYMEWVCECEKGTWRKKCVTGASLSKSPIGDTGETRKEAPKTRPSSVDER